MSRWRLPRWFFPDGNKTPLTYHPDPARWRRDDEHAYLKSVGRGQEFVLHLGGVPRGDRLACGAREGTGARAMHELMIRRHPCGRRSGDRHILNPEVRRNALHRWGTTDSALHKQDR